MHKTTTGKTSKKNGKGDLNVYYYENNPFAISDNNSGEITGIEIDILNYFTEWLEETKGVKIKVEYKGFDNYKDFYSALMVAQENSIGAGSVSITDERLKEVNFSTPYMNNTSVLITDGSIKGTRTVEELKVALSELRPIAIQGSVHEKHLNNLLEQCNLNKTSEYVNFPMAVPIKIAESSKYFGYVDIITFWKYIKENKHYVKMHKSANVNESFGFILPKNSDWDLIINEFFESGFGFTATKDYYDILEKYLGFEVLNAVTMD